MFVIYGHVLHRLREHLNVPGSSSVDQPTGDQPLTKEPKESGYEIVTWPTVHLTTESHVTEINHKILVGPSTPLYY